MPEKEFIFDPNYFIERLFKFSSEITVKYQAIADANETDESYFNSRLYMAANDEFDKFEDYVYSVEEMAAVGIVPGMEFYEQAVQDKYYIPTKYREPLLANKRKKIIEEFEEINPYYRMLNGLPPAGQEFYFVEEEGKYINELSDLELKKYREKFLELAISDLQNLKYLRYVGGYRISPYIARKACEFEIIQYDKTIFESQVNKIITEQYAISRTMMVNVYYNDGMKNQELYDGFIAIAILYDTLQKVLARQLDLGIRRRFFDKESIQNMFLSFGMPYIENIPIRYQTKLLNNMNDILQHKGTPKVLIDLCDLFAYGDTRLYKYYLVKDFKKYDPDTGMPLIKADYSNINDNYDLFFHKIPIDTTNITPYIENTSYRMDYENTIRKDHTWGNMDPSDIQQSIQDFKQQILDKEFNYICTKYLSVDVMLDLMRSMYETTYFFNTLMQFQQRGLLDQIRFGMNEVKPYENIPLFNYIMGIYYLLYHRYGYSEYLQYRPEAVGMIYNFNFDDPNAIARINEAVNHYIDKHERESFKEKYGQLFDVPTHQLTTDEYIAYFHTYLDHLEMLRMAAYKSNNYKEWYCLKEIYDIMRKTSSARCMFSNGQRLFTEENETPIIYSEENKLLMTRYGGIIDDDFLKVKYNGAKVLRKGIDYEVNMQGNTIKITSPIYSRDLSRITISYHRNEIDFTYQNLHDYLEENEPYLLIWCDEQIGLSEEPAEKASNITHAIFLIIDRIDRYFDTDQLDFLFDNLNISYKEDFKSYLYKLLITFKAYTIDLHSINNVFLLSDKYENTVKLIDRLFSITVHLTKGDSYKLRFAEFIRKSLSFMMEDNKDTPLLREKVHEAVHLLFDSDYFDLKLSDFTKFVVNLIESDRVHWSEYTKTWISVSELDEFDLKDFLREIVHLIETSIINFEDFISSSVPGLFADSLKLTIRDIEKRINKKRLDDKVSFREVFIMNTSSSGNP